MPISLRCGRLRSLTWFVATAIEAGKRGSPSPCSLSYQWLSNWSADIMADKGGKGIISEIAHVTRFGLWVLKKKTCLGQKNIYIYFSHGKLGKLTNRSRKECLIITLHFLCDNKKTGFSCFPNQLVMMVIHKVYQTDKGCFNRQHNSVRSVPLPTSEVSVLLLCWFCVGFPVWCDLHCWARRDLATALWKIKLLRGW